MYHTITAIKQANKAAGRHFFDPYTMRFFDSKVIPGVIGGRYFITSERFDAFSPRLYTVRVAGPDGEIDDASDFQQFTTVHAARGYAHALAKESPL